MINFTNNFQLNSDVCCGDKSISHRALILASIADGTCTIHNVSTCYDVLTTADCLRKLGATITFDGSTAVVCPIKQPNSNVVLQCNNSGTTARLLAGLVVGLNVNATFVGDKSLTCRPMDRVITPLMQMGADITKGDGILFAVHKTNGKLHGIVFDEQVHSAQVKSALLIAGLFAQGTTTYNESTPTRNHTELMLSNFGANIVGTSVSRLKGGKLHAFEITIPNDFSSVAFLLQLCQLTNKKATFCNVGVNTTRIGMLDVLQQGGTEITLHNLHTQFGEQVADITIIPHKLQDIFASAVQTSNAIDEMPALACIATLSKGTHTFYGVQELQYKECNRVDALIQTAKALGQQATFDGNNLVIVSNGILPKHPTFDSFGDHRIAMAQTVLCLACGGGVVNDTPYYVSFPNFLDAVGVHPVRLGLIGNDISGSMSPKLMMHFAKNANICCSYDLVDLPNDISDEILLQTISHYDGLNVTMPFKQRVATLLGANVPSVNVIGKRVAPTSTDDYGLITALKRNGIELNGQQLLVVGAGGACKACLPSLLQQGAVVKVVNRTQSNAQELTKQYNLATELSNVAGVLSFIPKCEYENTITLPNTTQFVFCADYKNVNNLQRQAQSKGIKYVHGLEMLYYQGAKAFSLWTDTPVQDDYSVFNEEK